MADSALPPPQTDLEYKTTRGAGIGYTTAAVPHLARTGTALTDEERKEVDKVVGSPAQGNAVPNDNLASVGALVDEVDSPSVLAQGSDATPSAQIPGESAPVAGEHAQTQDTEKQARKRG